MNLAHRLPHRLTLLCLAAALAACGGGGGGGGAEPPAPVGGGGSPAPAPTPPAPGPAAPPATAATVEFLGSVITPTAADAALYSLNATTRELTYTGSAAPAVGSVVVVGGQAYKIASRTEPAAGRFLLGTTTPAFEEVFERLRVNVEVALTSPAPAATTVGRIVPSGLAETIALASPASSASTLTGTIRNALATIDIDYSRTGGLARATMNVRGELAASGTVVATAGTAPTTLALSAATPISVPVPSSAGTLAFALPVDLIVRNDSQLQSTLTAWQGRWQFVTGASYNATTRAFENQSSVTDAIAPTTSPVVRPTLSGALNTGVGDRLIATRTTVSSVTVAPQIRAQLSAMNDSVGVLAVRQQIGVAATVDVTNTFPTMVDCAQMPIAIDQRAYAVPNYKAVESVIDLEANAGVAGWRLQSVRTPVRTATFGGECTVAPENFTINVNNSWKPLEQKLGQTEPDVRTGSITELPMAANDLLGRGRLVPGTVLNIQAFGAYTFTLGGIEQRFDVSGLFLDAAGNRLDPGAGSTVAPATRAAQCALSGPDPFANDFVMPNDATASAASTVWRVVVPAGAARLQLSVDDCVFYDNQGVPANPPGPIRVVIRPSAS